MAELLLWKTARTFAAVKRLCASRSTRTVRSSSDAFCRRGRPRRRSWSGNLDCGQVLPASSGPRGTRTDQVTLVTNGKGGTPDWFTREDFGASCAQLLRNPAGADERVGQSTQLLQTATVAPFLHFFEDFSNRGF